MPSATGSGQLVSGTAEWETVRKMVQRDLRDLRDHWGIRLEYDEPTHSYRLAPPFFTPDERRVLLAAVATVAVQGAPDGEPGELGATLDDRRALVVLRLHHLVATLRTAIGERRAVTFGLYGVERHVQPYALGMWRNRWYLAGHDLDRDTLRRYRLDRDRRRRSDDRAGRCCRMRTRSRPTSTSTPRSTSTPTCGGRIPRYQHASAWASTTWTRSVASSAARWSESDGRTAIVELDVRHYQSFRDRSARVPGLRGRARATGAGRGRARPPRRARGRRLMPPLGKQRHFEILRQVLATAEERRADLAG